MVTCAVVKLKGLLFVCFASLSGFQAVPIHVFAITKLKLFIGSLFEELSSFNFVARDTMSVKMANT